MVLCSMLIACSVAGLTYARMGESDDNRYRARSTGRMMSPLASGLPSHIVAHGIHTEWEWHTVSVHQSGRTNTVQVQVPETTGSI